MLPFGPNNPNRNDRKPWCNTSKVGMITGLVPSVKRVNRTDTRVSTSVSGLKEYMAKMFRSMTTWSWWHGTLSDWELVKDRALEQSCAQYSRSNVESRPSYRHCKSTLCSFWLLSHLLLSTFSLATGLRRCSSCRSRWLYRIFPQGCMDLSCIHSRESKALFVYFFMHELRSKLKTGIFITKNLAYFGCITQTNSSKVFHKICFKQSLPWNELFNYIFDREIQSLDAEPDFWKRNKQLRIDWPEYFKQELENIQWRTIGLIENMSDSWELSTSTMCLVRTWDMLGRSFDCCRSKQRTSNPQITSSYDNLLTLK